MFSSTVSSIGRGPLGPLFGALADVVGCSCCCSSFLASVDLAAFASPPLAAAAGAVAVAVDGAAGGSGGDAVMGFGGGVEPVGVELWTCMLGAVMFLWLRLELRLDLAVVGGGDLSLGDCGHTGVESPDADPVGGRCCCCCILGSFDTASVTGPA